jgi:hypothetical protein
LELGWLYGGHQNDQNVEDFEDVKGAMKGKTSHAYANSPSSVTTPKQPTFEEKKP